MHASWLILGISLLLLLVVEAGFRVRAAMRYRRQAAVPANLLHGDPRANAWHAAFTSEYNALREQGWKPYVYFARRGGFDGTHITVDTLARRVTPQPALPAQPAARVYFFGGSTMWGTSERDDHTIPAEASRRLQALVGPGRRIEVTNLAETGYVFTQGYLNLMLALRAGQRPDVVVFYEGLNDVTSTIQYGAAGIPMNESKRATEFRLGRALDRTAYVQGLGKDVKTLGMLAGQALQQLALVDWLKTVARRPSPTFIPADSAARATARVYAENVKLVEALATQYGFTPIYVWQPNIHASEKKLNAFEQRLRRNIERDAFHTRVQQTHRLMPALLDSTMAGRVPGRFVNAAGLFRGDTLAVYTDWLGHNTEASVPRIVDAFWPTLERATRDALARPRPPATQAPATIASVETDIH